MEVGATVDTSRVERALARFRALILPKLAQHATVASIRLATYIQEQKLSGQVLNSVTGRLKASVRPIESTIEGETVTGGAQAGGPETTTITKSTGQEVMWPWVQELGGTGPYEIVPVDAKSLRFEVGGKVLFARKVIHPALPARPFMAPSLEENREAITKELQLAVFETAEEAAAA